MYIHVLVADVILVINIYQLQFQNITFRSWDLCDPATAGQGLPGNGRSEIIRSCIQLDEYIREYRIDTLEHGEY